MHGMRSQNYHRLAKDMTGFDKDKIEARTARSVNSLLSSPKFSLQQIRETCSVSSKTLLAIA